MVEVKSLISTRPLPPVLSVGELSRRSGVAVSALHFYEAKGLISSVRSVGNQRRFFRGTLRRVAIIQIAQRLGIPLAEIREALAVLPEQGAANAEHWKELSAKWKSTLDSRIQQLEVLRDQLGHCIGCGCLTLEDCPLRNPGDVVGDTGAGARFVLDPSREEPEDDHAPSRGLPQA